MIDRMQPHLLLSKHTWKSFLKKEDWAIDTTCGNGHDTLFLTGLCHVIGIDIQPIAIENTQKLLDQHEKKAKLYKLSHANIDEVPLTRPPKLIVYNLGYLPKGDKKITTMADTTLTSLKKASEMLDTQGALSITCYPGHQEGAREEVTIESWAQTLGSHQWLVCHHRWLNRKGAPSWFWIQKLIYPFHLKGT